MNQSELPELILIKIFNYLTIKDLVRCYKVSKEWRLLVKKVKLSKLVLNFKETEAANEFTTKFMELNIESTKLEELNCYYNGELVDKDNVINFQKLDLNFINSITFKLDKLRCLKISNAEECRHIVIGKLCNLVDYKLIDTCFQYLEHLEMPIHYQFIDKTNSPFIRIPDNKEQLKLNLPLLKIISLYNIVDDLLFELELDSPLIEIIDLQNISLDYLKFSKTNSFSTVKILQLNQPNFLSSSILTQFKKLRQIRLTKNNQFVFSFRSTQVIFNQLFFTRNSLKLKKLKIYFIDKLLDPFKNFEHQINKNDEKYSKIFTTLFDTLSDDLI